jgi:hypothetical protein
MIPVLPLPYELREMIYDELEPHITITPQYPCNIRLAFEPDWIPPFPAHPMVGINKLMDDDIASRYYNSGREAQPDFLPEKTTFRIWAKHSRLMQMHMDAFCNKNRNSSGVRHVEYIFDCYDGNQEAHDELFAILNRFPNLKAAKIVLNYKAGIIDGEVAEIIKNFLKMHLEVFFPDVSTGPVPSCTGWKPERVKWEIQEFCVLEGEE